MAGISRKSLGAVRFDLSESTSPTSTSSRRRRSIAVQNVTQTHIEENDDEAERLARREKNENSPAPTPIGASDRRQSAIGLSAISNLSASEINQQISQCLKLNAENKINDKNAFQLKMIDFLIYALKKQDPNMSNLQMASVSLDASTKIYGIRVDKVYSDLLKILGMAKQDKKDQDENDVSGIVEQPDANQTKCQKKKKKNHQNILVARETLGGNIETYDPLSLIRCQRDTQTSDMLFQAGRPQHANQDVALNLNKDVLLDKVSNNIESSTIEIPDFHEFSNYEVCPSYAAFKFLDWSPDDEPEESKSQTEENNGEFRFDLDASVADNDGMDHDAHMDYGDDYEENYDRLAQNNQHVENIVDFQDIIANNPNPNTTYEYSYLQKHYRIHWAGPSHWKITFNKNLGGSRVVETCKQNAIKKKKEFELIYTAESKEERKLKFTQINKQTRILSKTTKSMWSEEKVTFPEDVHYDVKRCYTFYCRPSDCLKFPKNNQDPSKDNEYNIGFNDDHDDSNFGAADDEQFDLNMEDRFTQDQVDSQFNQETQGIQTQGAFIGDNLVSVPKLTDKIFIPYSQRAKKIDMRQLKKVMWKNLRKNCKEIEKENVDTTQVGDNENINKDIEPKNFSDMYMEVPKMLSKSNADSLSPAIAFVSLLHLSNEKNLKIDINTELSDLIIRSGKTEV